MLERHALVFHGRRRSLALLFRFAFYEGARAELVTRDPSRSVDLSRRSPALS